MKKITITTTGEFVGQQWGIDLEDNPLTVKATDYYVSDECTFDADIECYWTGIDAPFDCEVGVNYTSTLMNIDRRLAAIVDEMEYASGELWDFVERIEADTTLSEGDREKLVSAMDAAYHEIGRIWEECEGDAAAAVQGALDAFKSIRLPE